MDIEAKRKESGEFELEIGPVVFTLPVEVVKALNTLLEERLNNPSAADDESHKRKLTAYRELASKMIGVDDRIVQKFSPQVTPEQLVTIVRLAEGDALYQKVVKNLSKQNRRQFEADYADLDKITEQQACLHMEQLVPMIKLAAQEQAG
jgi:flagellar motor switch protein FliG